MTTSRNGFGSSDGNSAASTRTKTVLKGVDGGVAGKSYLLDMPEVVVGRSTRATLRLTHRGVSRRHARLVASNGAYYVEDLGSVRGTFVNERQIKERTFLNDGDNLKVGRVSFTVAFIEDLNAFQGPLERVSRANVPALSADPELADFAEFILANTTVTSALPDSDAGDDEEEDDDDEA